MFWSKKPTPPPLPKEPVPLGEGHPGVFDSPKNPLEAALVAVRARKIQIPEFLQELFNSDVFVLPLAKDFVAGQNGRLTLSKTPTFFCMNYPEYSALGLYTSQERAKPTCDLHPEFRFATKVPAGEFLLKLTGNFGLVINPYWDVNLEWNNQQVARILAMIERE